MAPSPSATLAPARRFADVALATVILLVVGMMIVPLPTGLLDVLIAGNVSIAVLMLLVSMYISGGLEFTAFPTILLVTTLYRLALNVSSTRLILLQADAGDVIAAFGNFVVQGNYVVGAVVFLILTLIQFLVIAKGSERVAEVGARFTLDAMPGKQMSIDAELRSGAISQDEARRKRASLQRESQFYGAMDGAMKFVKGDAIAGIVITVVNILGGLAIGVAQRDMSAGDALQTYGLLTIGDGLVSQIPALLISTAAGLVVTRVASENEGATLGGDVASQVFGNPKALTIAAAFLAVLAIVPGLPALPFLVIAIVFFLIARRLQRAAQPEEATAVVAKEEAARETKARQAMVPLVVPVSIEVGAALAESVAGPGGSGPLLEDEVPLLRDRLFLDLGVALPGVRARSMNHLEPEGYVIAMQEVPLASGTIRPDRVLALDSAAVLASLGVDAEPAVDPATGGPAAWVDPASDAVLEAAGVPTLEPAAIVAHHLGAVVRRRAGQLLGLQEAQSMLDQLERAYPALVRHVVPKPVSLSLLTDVLRRLVEEGVSVRPLREILESLATHAPNERDPVALTELVRSALRQQITHHHSVDGVLPVVLLDPSIEEAVRDSIQRTATGSYLALPPAVARDVLEAFKQECPPDEGAAIVLTQADVRRFVRRLVEVELPDVTVLSYQELAPEVTVQPLGRVQI
ncbi:MAG: type III secretion system export apparatus subunit SctV [Deltaproteobacteria bacterium]|nr:type III secretion system export apparatus subunit SctV [Deltaproteobacteria bacterium]